MLNVEPAAELSLEMFSIPREDGLQLQAWRVSHGRGAPVILASGFGHRMSRLAALAHYVATNGRDVYRYDPCNHVGLSAGDIRDFTLSDALTSMRATVRWVQERTQQAPVLVASSISGRVALRLSAEVQLERLILVVPVVDLRSTLRRVFAEDYFGYVPEALPEFVTFDRVHHVRTRTFYESSRKDHWESREQSQRDAAQSSAPISVFLGADDPWVDSAEVHDALSSSRAWQESFVLESGAHDLGKNPSVARELLRRVTAACCQRSPHDVREPAFAELTKRAISESRLARADKTDARRKTPLEDAT